MAQTASRTGVSYKLPHAPVGDGLPVVVVTDMMEAISVNVSGEEWAEHHDWVTRRLEEFGYI